MLYPSASLWVVTPAHRLHGRCAGTSGASLSESGEPRVHLSLTPRRQLPLPGTDPSPPLGRGGAPRPSHGEPSAPVSVRLSLPLPTHSQSRRAASHPTATPILYLGLHSSGPSSGTNTGRAQPRGRQRSPSPAPFTTPLGLQTVTLATDLSAASPAPAARTRRTLIGAAAAPPCAARQAPPSPPAARSDWDTSFARPSPAPPPPLPVLRGGPGQSHVLAYVTGQAPAPCAQTSAAPSGGAWLPRLGVTGAWRMSAPLRVAGNVPGAEWVAGLCS